ncbi:Nn.00g074120.m01.CDS01 [Neocucurbitaria sp. VM-36]
MATYNPYSHSPRMQAGNPITPVHSPHHSVTSSVSSRTPIHTLTIHEYRKQQHTPNSQKGTPAGKTLRRKAAASALSDIERVPSITRSTRSGSGSSLHPLHFSQSAQQLKPNQSSFEQQALLDISLRSQSAEPRVHGDSISSSPTVNISGKVRHFNSRKRLPRPPAATGPLVYPFPFANVKSSQNRRSPLPAALSFSTEFSHSSNTQTTPTPSSFSLSRFPPPPQPELPPFPPLREDKEDTRLNTLSFATTAPVTPPATPATIHYRGASFDLVNPHDSLVLHDIVTPSRDFDSSEFLPLRSSEEPLLLSSEMAPKRPLYGDISSARAGIMRRADDSFSGSNFDLPLPPVPAAISPSSSTYTSPIYSPESIDAPSPLSIRKPTDEPRFSLRNLTRTLTKKLGKSPVMTQGEELQDLRATSASLASIDMDGKYPRSLDQTYIATPQASYFPVSSVSPMTPTSPTFPEGLGSHSAEEQEVDYLQRESTKSYDVEPLTSMVPEEPSTQMGRVGHSQSNMSEEGLSSKPYYDDLDSIYPSSSIYTADDRRKSNYQQSLVNNRQSNPFVRYSSMNASSWADEYNRDSLYGYSSGYTDSHRMSRPPTKEPYHHLGDRGDPKTDTISKLIDEYNPDDMANNPSAMLPDHTTNASGPVTSQSGSYKENSVIGHSEPARVKSGFSQFEFELQQDAPQTRDHEYVSPIQRVIARRPTIARHPGSPPREAAPLAPAFEYDEAFPTPSRPQVSEMLSNGSFQSYGDTRNLLQLPQSQVSLAPVQTHGLEPSSSYSQPEHKALEPSSSYSQPDDQANSHTPQKAIDQADKIFQNTVIEHQQRNDGIPAIWARRSSGSLLLSKKITNQSSGNSKDHEIAAGEDKADWETLAGDSQAGRDSLGSIADYSSSEGTRNSLGLNSDRSLQSWQKLSHSQGASLYSHTSPLRSHPHTFNSSPPDVKGHTSARLFPEDSSSPVGSKAPVSSTVPVFRASTFRASTRLENVLGRGAVDEPYAFAPWADPYAFSDKETQELLASGPNDNILIDDESGLPNQPNPGSHQEGHLVAPRSTENVPDSPVSVQRENSFEKFSVVGPKGNLTGTPRGTGMHETGSSVADTSSPGQRLSSSVGRRTFRSDYTGFYAAPFPATGSVTRIRDSRPPPEPQHERTPSQETLFPGAYGIEPVQEFPPIVGTNRRQSLRYSTTFQRARHGSRAAVPGQTKLRQMVLAPEGRATMSSQDTHFSRFINGSGRPSTSDTKTPLRSSHPSLGTYPATARTIVAHEHSPHLLCPEREVNPEDEARRRKLSWIILSVFCLLPPCIILFRVWGDSIIISLTEGRLGHCTAQSKRASLIAGICVNLGIATAILVPILVVHALKAV